MEIKETVFSPGVIAHVFSKDINAVYNLLRKKDIKYPRGVSLLEVIQLIPDLRDIPDFDFSNAEMLSTALQMIGYSFESTIDQDSPKEEKREKKKEEKKDNEYGVPGSLMWVPSNDTGKMLVDFAITTLSSNGGEMTSRQFNEIGKKFCDDNDIEGYLFTLARSYLRNNWKISFTNAGRNSYWRINT